MDVESILKNIVNDSKKIIHFVSPTPGQSLLPDDAPQSADDDVVEAGELPERSRATPGWSRLLDGGPQSAGDVYFLITEITSNCTITMQKRI